MREQNATLSWKQSYNSIRKFRKTTPCQKKNRTSSPSDSATQPCIHAADQASGMPSVRAEPASDFDIGEEFGTAKKNLPPIKILGICAAVVIVVVVVASFLQRPKPKRLRRH